MVGFEGPKTLEQKFDFYANFDQIRRKSVLKPTKKVFQHERGQQIVGSIGIQLVILLRLKYVKDESLKGSSVAQKIF